jgi:hypothetical protein
MGAVRDGRYINMKQHQWFGEKEKGREGQGEDLHPDVLMSVTLGVQFSFGVVEVHAPEVG